MPAGRPSEYREGYGTEVVNLMAEGLSLTAAMADLGFHRETALNWGKEHPEFFDAVKRGQAKRTAFLERRMLSAVESPVVTSCIFALKNAAPDEWREKSAVDHSGTLTLEGLVASSMPKDGK